MQGLITKSTNKLNSPEICEIFNKNDIIMLVETWGHRHINFNVPNFRFFELNRTVYKSATKRSSGGIIVYIRESLIKSDSVVLLTTDSDDIIWLRLDDIANLKENVFLCLCYNLPT